MIVLKDLYNYFAFSFPNELKGLIKQRSLKLLVVFFILFALLNHLLQSFYDKYIVDGILSTINNSKIHSYIFVCLAILILLFSVSRIYYRKRVSLIYFLIVFAIFQIHLYYWKTGEYEYYHFSSNWLKDFRYTDLIILFFAVSVLELIIGFYFKFNKPKYETNPFVIDTPIQNSSLDLFGRKQFAEEIASKIKSKYNSKSSLAIAIDGPWGSGKTSFVGMIKEAINKEEGNKNRLIIDFHPWKSTTPQQIILDFFDLFTDEIKKISPNLSTKINNYAKTLTKVDENVITQSINAIIELFDEDKSKEIQYNAVNEALENQNKQIIVIIDDIDRLDKKEIIEVIRLIRNTASFHNTIFIVTYEREYLLNAIKELNEHRYTNFLEKIFQFEFTLPSFEKTILKNALLSKVIDKLNDDHKSFFNSILYPSNGISYGLPFGRTEDFFDLHIRTYRDVIRYVNSFLFDYKFIKDEITIEDFAILQILKLKYPDVYDLLYEKKGVFLNSAASTYFSGSLVYSLKNREGESITELFYYLSDNCHLVKYKKCEIPEIIELVNSLFSSEIMNAQKQDQKSISIADNFYKYFANRVFAGEISIGQFEAAFSQPYENFIQFLDDWISQDYLNDISIRLSRVDISKLESQIDFEKYIKAIFYFSSRTARAGNSYLFDTNKLYSLLYATEDSNLITSHYKGYVESYKKFLRKLFKDAISPYAFESWFIRTIKDQQMGHFILPMDELQGFQIDYLKKYLNEVKNFDRNVWSLIYDNKLFNKINESGGSFQVERVANPDVFPLVLKFIEKNKLLDEFLKDLIRLEPFKKKRVGIVFDAINAIFGRVEKFEEYLTQQVGNRNSKYIKEFSDFYNKLKENGYNFIDFNFKKIPKPISK